MFEQAKEFILGLFGGFSPAPTKKYERWSDAEIKLLKELMQKNLSLSEISVNFSRSKRAVAHKIRSIKNAKKPRQE